MTKGRKILLLIFIIIPFTCLGQIDKSILQQLRKEKNISFPSEELADSIEKEMKPSLVEAETLSTIEKMFNEKYMITTRRTNLEILKDSLSEQVKAESLKIELRRQYLADAQLQDKYLIPSDTTYFALRKKLSKTNKQIDSISVTLKQFGYDMLQNSVYKISSLAPVADNYILGPEDELYIDITGELNDSWIVKINRDGSIVLPNVGNIQLWGQTYGESKKIISEKFQSEFSNIAVNVSLGNLKSVNVFVLGEVNNPGIHNITMLSNPLAAIFKAQGLKKSGSLRKIKYISGDGSRKNIDLYKLFIKGESLTQLQFSSGDIIFVPPIGKVVGVNGAVNRPGIYETESTESLRDVIEMAGGFLPTAGIKRIQLERVSTEEEKIIKDLKFENEKDFDRISKNFRIENGDLAQIFEIPPYHHNYVEITGNVKNEGKYELKKDMTVLDLIEEAGGAKKGILLKNAELIRFTGTKNPEIITINLKKLMKDSLEDNFKLKEYDRLRILSQSKQEQFVYLHGEFTYPGRYLIKDGTTLKEAIDRAGGFTENAFLEGAVLTKNSIKQLQNEALEDLIRETRLGLIQSQRAVMGSYDTETAKEAYMRYLQLQQDYLSDLKKIQEPGRVIINLLDPVQLNITLEDGDRIEVPKLTKIVQVLGEVYYATGIAYREGLSIEDYIEIAGGPKPSADKKQIYVQRPSGKIEKGAVEIKPGDKIVVPEKVHVERSVWQILGYTVDILYKVALAVVAFNAITSN